MTRKLDVLVFASHPDDAEIGCGGTMAAMIASGKNVGLVDLTKGELGTRGSIESRKAEAERAASLLGLSVRENIGLPDGYIRNDQESLRKVISVIRKYRPELVLANAAYDRHPDHGHGGDLVSEASFLSGLIKVSTEELGQEQLAWRPRSVYHYIQDRYIKPDIIIDITPFWSIKIEAIKAFKSQFFDPESSEPATYISDPEFLVFLEARCREMGHAIGVRYGEGFTTDRGRAVGIRDLFDLV